MPWVNWRQLLALQVRLGGLGLVSPVDLRNEFEVSVSITTPLVTLIHSQSLKFPFETLDDQFKAKSHQKCQKVHNI